MDRNAKKRKLAAVAPTNAGMKLMKASIPEKKLPAASSLDENSTSNSREEPREDCTAPGESGKTRDDPEKMSKKRSKKKSKKQAEKAAFEEIEKKAAAEEKDVDSDAEDNDEDAVDDADTDIDETDDEDKHIFSICLWNYGFDTRKVILELIINLAAVPDKYLDGCLEMLVANFVPPRSIRECSNH